MKIAGVILTMGILLIAGCAKKEETNWEEAQFEEVQFKVCLRSQPYERGDTTLSGEFEDLLVVSLPVELKGGPGKAHAVQNGVWIHIAWDDVHVDENSSCLVFDGFRSLVENRFSSPYGTTWWDIGWQERGRTGFSEKWERLQTSVRIASTSEDPRIWCKMWRWNRNTERPDIVLGDKRPREPATATDG